jgi:hypothetical protein
MGTQIEIVTPEIQKETETALTIINSANSLIIQNVTDYKYAQVTMRELKDRISELTDTRMAQTRPLDESKAKIIAFFAPTLQKLEKAKNYLNTIMVKFAEEQETERREEEYKLNAAKNKREEEDALARAIEAEEAGEKEEAEQILKEPSTSAPIKVMSEIPKSKGSYIRENWSAEIFDLAILIKAIANNEVSLEAASGVIYSNADDLKKWAGQYMTFLNGKARSYKQTLNIPGVRAVSEKKQI